MFALSTFAADENNCIIPADADILGLGVRLGLYFQFASNILITYARPMEGVSSITVSNIFFTGFFVAVIHSTVHNNLAPSVLCTILQLLIMDIIVALPIAMIAGSHSNIANVAISIWAIWFSIIRSTGVAVFQLWFWYKGIDVSNDAQCMDPYFFLFTKLDAYGGVRTAFKVLSVLGIVGMTYYVVLVTSSVYKRAFNYDGHPDDRWSYKLEIEELLPRQNDEQYDNYGVVKLLKRMISWLALYAIVSGLVTFIIGTELAIKWNHLDGLTKIDTTGQLIPFTVGLISIFGAIFLLFIGKE